MQIFCLIYVVLQSNFANTTDPAENNKNIGQSIEQTADLLNSMVGSTLDNYYTDTVETTNEIQNGLQDVQNSVQDFMNETLPGLENAMTTYISGVQHGISLSTLSAVFGSKETGITMWVLYQTDSIQAFEIQTAWYKNFTDLTQDIGITKLPEMVTLKQLFKTALSQDSQITFYDLKTLAQNARNEWSNEVPNSNLADNTFDLITNLTDLREASLNFQALLDKFGDRIASFHESVLFEGLPDEDRNYFYDILDLSSGYVGFIAAIAEAEKVPKNSMKQLEANFAEESVTVSEHMRKAFEYSMVMDAVNSGVCLKSSDGSFISVLCLSLFVLKMFIII